MEGRHEAGFQELCKVPCTATRSIRAFCALWPALTRIAGTRVVVGMDASLVAAPDGGPSFLAAGTRLVRRKEDR